MDDDALKQGPKFKYLDSIFTEEGKNKGRHNTTN